MPSTRQIAELRRTVDDVLALAGNDVAALFRTVAGTNPPAATAALVAELPAVVQAWGDVASTVTADWYALTRPAGLAAFNPTPAAPAPTEQVEAMTRWAVGPLYRAYDWDAALRDLTAGSSRLVRNASRDTIETNSLADSGTVGYVRVARIDACSFCLMLASRGAVYKSEASATTVGTGRVRGRQGAGSRFHDSCRCTTAPVYDADADVPEFNKALSREWQQVTRGRADAFDAWSEHISLTRV